jgi:regulatory protein
VNLKSKITAIKAVRNRRAQRSRIYLDGQFAFSLDNEVIVREGLKTGQGLSSAEIGLLTGDDRFQGCFDAACRFLSYRPRSEAETRTRLLRRGYAEEEIEKAVGRLRKLNLLDDAAFAEFWKENRNAFQPRSQRLLKLELQRKGVEAAMIDDAVEGTDDADNAYRAAVKKARTLPVADYKIFRQRLAAYLQRRGFNYRVISSVVEKTWQERTSGTGQHPDLSGAGVNDQALFVPGINIR